jgi:hypothetical protein
LVISYFIPLRKGGGFHHLSKKREIEGEALLPCQIFYQWWKCGAFGGFTRFRVGVYQ